MGDAAQAQVTRGGAPVAEFDPETMASRRVEGLFAAGEVLDVDGRSGGFNLHWAWASGIVAGEAAARVAHVTGAGRRRQLKRHCVIVVRNLALPLSAGGPSAQGALASAAARRLGIDETRIASVRITKRSVDARRKSNVHFVATLEVTLDDATGEDEDGRGEPRGGRRRVRRGRPAAARHRETGGRPQGAPRRRGRGPGRAVRSARSGSVGCAPTRARARRAGRHAHPSGGGVHPRGRARPGVQHPVR